MKRLVCLALLFMATGSWAQRVEFPTAKFITGDNIAYSYPSYEDLQWQDIKTNIPWEQQGHPSYDGFAWYRFHMIIQPSLKKNSLWKDSLRIFLSKIDDACEVYLNAILIGKSGSFPDEKNGYITTWNKTQEIHISSTHPNLNWGGENILSVRVYDGGGAGGIFGAVPFASMLDLIDGMTINNSEPVKFLSNTEGKKTISLTNAFSQKITGQFNYTITDVEQKTTDKHSVPVTVMPHGKFDITIPIALSERTNLLYEFEESNTKKTIQLNEALPYRLTPPAPATPRINGASVFGVRPNSPFLFKIPATGQKPIKYSVENLPKGLQLNSQNGVISGSISKAGDYKMVFVASNALGTDKKEFTVSCGNLLALTPPMGWNSWNCWGLTISDEKLKASAKALIDKGLIDHGWTYMNIDDGWEADIRNPNGTISTNKKFADLKKTSNWLHDNGLKLGIYSSPGPQTCGGFLGSYQHELQDATSYAAWGVDYLKYDWCSYGEIHDKRDSSLESFTRPYTVMQDALQRQPRDIVYSLCQYGMKDVWTWGASVNGNCWRTTGDIEDTWASLSSIGFSQNSQFSYAKPGRWNDPDMMIVGRVGWGNSTHPTRLTPDEQYTHVSLWSMLSAPLLIGCDLSKLDDFTLNLLTNDEVIAIDQDRLGKQARQVMKTDDYQVWMKDLEDGGKAIAVFNLTDNDNVIRFYWNNLGLTENHQVRDLWRQKDLGNYPTMFSSKVAPHGVTLIKIKP